MGIFHLLLTIIGRMIKRSLFKQACKNICDACGTTVASLCAKEMMKITNIDHIVLTVKDIDETIIFYESVMGMKKETFGKERVALRFGSQKINLHEYGNELEPKANNPKPGSEDLCFITETKLEEAMTHVKNNGITIIEGPVSRTGALGRVLSFYFRDPDGNLIEVSTY